MKLLRACWLVALLGVAAGASPLAAAHAVLKSSEPQSGAVLSAPPPQIVLRFNEKIEPAFSTVSVSTAKGAPLATGKAAPDPGDPAVLKLALPVLAPAVYTVKWAVAGQDGHRRTGEFQFTVK